MAPPGIAHVARFRAVIARRFGLLFDETKTSQLEEVLKRRLAGEDVDPYLSRLERLDRTELRGELRELARELTVQETYFFRHREQFQAFAEVALPTRLSARDPAAAVHVLSAGCATGEEAYSLAIAVRETGLVDQGRVLVRAVDLSPGGSQKTTPGQYSAWSLRDMPDDLRRKWFVPSGRVFTLDSRVRAAVTFEERNLALDDPGLWPRGFYDVVFCRNVIMYFTPDAARALLARMASAMAPGGYLFIGHAETLRGLSDDFVVRNTHGAFYYQRKGSTLEATPVSRYPATPAPPVASSPVLPPASPLPSLPVANADEWIATVERSAARIRSLASTSAELAPRRSSPQPIDVALEALKSERFAEALKLLEALPALEQGDDVLLLRAVLLVHTGELAKAEDVCARLLVLAPGHAGAHHVLALCRENAGDLASARRYDEVAVSMDPAFAMAHLHLALMARRAGDRNAARRAFREALDRIEREDPARLVLFGGGFGRDGLVALCRAELHALGGRS